MVTIITHNDLDGSACAALLVAGLHLDYPQICSTSYDAIDHEVTKALEDLSNDRLYITDISPSESVCEQIDLAVKNGRSIYLVDHHITKKFIAKFSWATFDTEVSATELVLTKVLHKDIVDPWTYGQFSKAVTAWDLWQLYSTHRKRGEALNSLHTFWGSCRFIRAFSQNARTDETQAELLCVLREKRVNYIDNIIKRQITKAPRFMDGTGHTFLVVISNEYSADLAHAILEQEPDLHYVVVANVMYNNCGLYSRSKDDVDVSKIASHFGGGGHVHAAGFPMSLRQLVVDPVFSLLNTLEK